jgi:hypothetical protein
LQAQRRLPIVVVRCPNDQQDFEGRVIETTTYQTRMAERRLDALPPGNEWARALWRLLTIFAHGLKII